jgi:hypothetical protein
MDDAGMDPHGDPPGMDPHDLGPPGLEPHDLDRHGLEHDGMAAGGPEPGLDDLGAADPGWPDGLDAGHGEHLDPDLASAETADLSFAEDYHPGGHPFPGDLHDLGGDEEPLFGADPDLHPLADLGPGEDQPFPPTLDLDPPEPIDGYPWTDPADLGHDVLPPLDDTGGGPDPADLFEYAGEQPPAGDAWSALLASPDPATSALARWWSAG